MLNIIIIVDYYSQFYEVEVEVMQSTTAERSLTAWQTPSLDMGYQLPSNLTMAHSSNQVNLENIVNSKAQSYRQVGPSQRGGAEAESVTIEASAVCSGRKQTLECRMKWAKWAQANGEVQRQNRSLLKRLQFAQAENKPWRAE